MCVGTTAAIISPFSSTSTRLRILLLQRRMEGEASTIAGQERARRTSLFRGGSKESDGGNANHNQSKREREPQDHVKFRAGGRTCLLVRIGYS